MCVIAGRFDIGPWIKKADATCLIEGFEGTFVTPELPQSVTESLDAMLGFDGHNGFIGAGGKEYTIRLLRSIARGPNRPTPQALEGYLLASDETSAEGAQQARRWYEEILHGKAHRDHGGHIIR